MSRRFDVAKSAMRRSGLIVTSIVLSIAVGHSQASAQGFATLDIAVLLDSSGSVGATGWNLGIEFLTELIRVHRPPNSRMALVQFSTGVVRRHQFTDDQSGTALLAALNGLDYTGGFAHMRAALLDAVAMFDEQSEPPGHDKLILLVTDGTPSPIPEQEPCGIRETLENAGVHMLIVGVGPGWTPSMVECLVAEAAPEIAYVGDVGHQLVSFDRFRSAMTPTMADWRVLGAVLIAVSAVAIVLVRRHPLLFRSPSH